MLTTPVTLITDFGLRDPYAGILKGILLKRCPSLKLLDLTHNINPFDIVQAAYVLRNSYLHFPEGTIHLCWVNNEPVEPMPFVLVRHTGQCFLAPDNGLLSMVFEEKPVDAVLISGAEQGLYGQMNLLGEKIGLLAEGVGLDAVGTPLESWKKRVGVQPVTFKDQIRGTVIYIDEFGNAITNIRKADFYKVGRGRPFALYFRQHDPISKLSGHYSDVQVGAPLCWFNAEGDLEIAVNMGNAAGLLGLKVEDTVQVEFEEEE